MEGGSKSGLAHAARECSTNKVTAHATTPEQSTTGAAAHSRTHDAFRFFDLPPELRDRCSRLLTCEIVYLESVKLLVNDFVEGPYRLVCRQFTYEYDKEVFRHSRADVRVHLESCISPLSPAV